MSDVEEDVQAGEDEFAGLPEVSRCVWMLAKLSGCSSTAMQAR